MFGFLFGKSKADETPESTALDWQVRDKHGHTLIANGTHIMGDIRFSGLLRIDGRVDGKVMVHEGKKGMLILSRSAVINGPVRCSDLVTDGTINGTVNVDNRLECRAQSVITGEVHYGNMHISEGAVIEGRCTKRALSTPEAVEYRQNTAEEGVAQISTFLKKQQQQNQK